MQQLKKQFEKFGFLRPYEFQQPATKITKQSKNVGRFKNPNLSYKHILSERGIGSCWDFQYPIFFVIMYLIIFEKYYLSLYPIKVVCTLSPTPSFPDTPQPLSLVICPL